MGSRWLARSAAFAAAAVGVLAFASPAMATDSKNIPIQGALPKSVTSVENNCDAKFGGGPWEGFDVWVFNLPKTTGGVAGTFIAVHGTWGTPGTDADNASYTIDSFADSGFAAAGDGTWKAWIKLPHGLELKAADADVSTDSKEFFTLTHTCEGTPGQGESPSPEASPSEGTQESPTPGQSEGTRPSPSASTPGLPVTGTAVAGIVTTGVLLIGVGVGLVLMHRRRSLTDAAE